MREALLALFICLAWGESAQALTLNEVFEAAWNRSVTENVHSEKTKSLDAAIDAASSLTPNAPSLVGEYRHELLYGLKRSAISPASLSSDGSGTITPASINRETSVDGNELRVGISVPLWLPSQRSRSINAAKADMSAYAADYHAAKLDLAGELRALVADLRAANIEVGLATATVQESSSLVEDVAKRVKAGDLAKSDLGKVVADQKTAQADLLRAKQRQRKAMAIYETLTGLKTLPTGPEKLAENAQIDRHPRLHKLKADLDAAKAKVSKVKSEVVDTPEVGLTYARILNSRINPADEAIIVSFKVPLPSLSRYEAKTFEASAERTRAAVLAQREAESVLSAFATATRDLEAASTEVAAMQAAFESVQQVYAGAQRAFELGESDLSTLLKAAADKRRSSLRLESATLSKETAIAAYNQSLGVLP